MNPQLIQQAQQDVNTVYDPITASMQGQVPAIQQLYTTLLQGLQGQQQNQLGNVLQSAQQRGVARAGLAGDAGGMLNDALSLQAAQLGAQQGQQVAGIGQQIGQTNVERAQAVNQGAQSLQNQANEAQQNQMQLTNIERKAQAEQLANQQDFNVKQAAFQTAQANARASAAASAKGLADLSADSISRQLRIGLNSVKGKDGHVSPENLANAYKIWNAAGLAPDAFWKNYQGLWNPNQGDYNAQFHYFAGQ